MKVFAIYKTGNGELISVETDQSAQSTDAQLAAQQLARKEISHELLPSEWWNPATRSVENKPAPTLTPEETLRLSLLGMNSVTATTGNIFDALKLLLKKVSF